MSYSRMPYRFRSRAFSSARTSASIVHGDFEEPDFGIGVFRLVSELPGWKALDEQLVEVQARCCGTRREGDQYIELGAQGNTTDCQELETVPDAKFVLCFAYSPRPRVRLDSNGVEALIDGEVVRLMEADGMANADTAWQRHRRSQRRTHRRLIEASSNEVARP